MRNLSSLALIVTLSLGFGSVARAQEPSSHHERVSLDPHLRLTLDDTARAAALGAIDDQAHVATALYVTGIVLLVGGVGTAIATSIAGICTNYGVLWGDRPSSCRAEHEMTAVGLGVGSAIAGLGLLGIFTAIALDVGSGQRRRALDPSIAIGVGPTLGGASLTFSGAF